MCGAGKFRVKVNGTLRVKIQGYKIKIYKDFFAFKPSFNSLVIELI